MMIYICINQKRPLKTNNHLTKREIEIIQLISEGIENIEISVLLSISVRTVESHRKNILSKFSAKNFCLVISYCYKNKILKI